MRQQYLASDPVPQFSTAWNYIALKVYAYSKNVVTFGRDGGPDKPGRGNGVRSPAFPVIMKAARTRLGTPFTVYRRTSPNPKTCPIPGQAHRGGDRRAGGKASAKQTRVKLPSNSSYSSNFKQLSRRTNPQQTHGSTLGSRDGGTTTEHRACAHRTSDAQISEFYLFHTEQIGKPFLRTLGLVRLFCPHN